MMSSERLSHAWSIHYGTDGRESIQSADGLLSILDGLSRRRPPLAVSLISPSAKTLVLGVGRKDSVVLFQASDDPPYFQSIGDRHCRGVILFDYGDQQTEFAQGAAVAYPAALRAAVEFFSTEERPTCLDWEEV